MHRFAPTTRYIPAGSTKVAAKAPSDAVAYLYTSRPTQSAPARPCAVIYWGKSAKPVAHNRYRDEAERARIVGQWFARRLANLATQQQYKTEAKAQAQTFAAELQAGDIVHYSFGYDETHHCFAQITRVKGKTAWVRPIAQAQEDLGYDWRHRCMPQSDDFTGPETRHIIQNGYLRMGHYRASKWNTATVAGVRVGPSYVGGGCH